MERFHPRRLAVHKASGVLRIDNGTIPIDETGIVFSLQNGSIICSWRNGSRKTMYAEFIPSSLMHISIPGTADDCDRVYSGSIEVGIDGNEFVLVNTTTVDDYVSGAAMSELGPLLSAGNPDSAGRKNLMRAMETSIRSCLYHSGDRHKDHPWQFCDLTHCFHFRGLPPVERRKPETFECLLSPDGIPVEAFFHSTCGGVIAPPLVMWPLHDDPALYRTGADRVDEHGDMLCAVSPHYIWSARINSGQMDRILGSTNVSDIEAITVHGRVSSLDYCTGKGERRNMPIARFMSGCGRSLGWNVVKSNCFTIAERNGFFVIRGKGLGHGTGLCQYGAASLALRGYTWRQILEFYYPGARIARVIE